METKYFSSEKTNILINREKIEQMKSTWKLRMLPAPPPPPQKKNNWKRLIDHRTKGSSSIINFFYFSIKHPNLDSEIQFAQILCQMIEIHKFQNWQVDFNFQNFAGVHSIDCHNACTQNNMSLWEIHVEYKLK